jgi:hypothetical protein
MASSEVVNLIISMTSDFMTYMLPIIGALAGITLVLSFFIYVSVGSARTIFSR